MRDLIYQIAQPLEMTMKKILSKILMALALATTIITIAPPSAGTAFAGDYDPSYGWGAPW
jgi:hypothetical protein